MRIRMPVFISNVAANETFGLPPIDGCPVEICYHNATSAKFWGKSTGRTVPALQQQPV